jgi:hypothetical protein
VFIEIGHKDECTHYGSNLEACTFVVTQDQAFEAGLQMKFNCVWSKVELKNGLDKWWRDQPRC